jgi:hypothetical protein
MNPTALKLETTLRAIGETWAKDAIKRYGGSNLSDMCNVEGYGPRIAKSARAMAAIKTLMKDNPDLRKDHALTLAANGAASTINHAAGH